MWWLNSPQEKLRRVLAYVFDEGEFLSPYGIRSLSKVPHKGLGALTFGKAHEVPVEVRLCDATYSICYTPGESTSKLFGGNSNWRGPIWWRTQREAGADVRRMPINFLLVEALRRYHFAYGSDVKFEYPTRPVHPPPF